jgi:hypothetical protein
MEYTSPCNSPTIMPFGVRGVCVIDSTRASLTPDYRFVATSSSNFTKDPPKMSSELQPPSLRTRSEGTGMERDNLTFHT